MKFMKLGTRPDTFYTEEATSNVTLNLDDIPGGDEAFELCAKFCYGITINLSAHNYVSAFCAAKFLRMTEAVENGNFVMKLEAFFSSCILQGWKDPIVTLHNTERVYEWSENLGIVRRCIESIVDKILTPPTKVTWSYTYTRPGYEKKRHQSVPKDWWTEDISFLEIDIFRCIVAAIKSTNILQPRLIGEALHVYACRWLPDETRSNEGSASTSQVEESSGRKRKILETIVSLIPADHKGSVSIKFLLKLLSIANFLTVSPVTKAELLRLAGLQLEEANLSDLMLPCPNNRTSNDIDLVKAVLESFLRQWKRQKPEDESLSMRSICKVGKLIDSYLQVVAKDVNMPVQKVASLAETLPGIARPNHDDLYMAINIYLKEHPDLSKTNKKQLCRVLDCQKLSPEVRAHAVRNERLPLRTVVQVLFFEQEIGNSTANKKQISPEQLSKPKSSAYDNSHKGKRTSAPVANKIHDNLWKSDEIREVKGPEMEKGRASALQLSPREKALVRRISEKSHS
ncbi:hypothetical protein DH2020_017132 [Rehmannia glutinosa]|uniref:NPH3 domain-containing protein n=1 Tax=Rehmannia glutinosa TaxID=99300 RepID=A0ABR0WTC9_REHGL